MLGATTCRWFSRIALGVFSISCASIVSFRVSSSVQSSWITEGPSVDDSIVFNAVSSHLLAKMALPMAKAGHLFSMHCIRPQWMKDALNYSENGAQAVLSLLAASDLLAYQQEGGANCYSPTEAAKLYLAEESPFYYGSWVPTWETPIADTCFGQLYWNGGLTVEANHMSELAGDEAFFQAMKFITRQRAATAGQHGVFRNIKHVLDVGGGPGTLTLGLAGNNPSMKASILDPFSCPTARKEIDDQGMSDHVTCITGSMFDPLPRGFDAMFFGNVLHDWHDKAVRAIISNVYKSLGSGGFMIIHEQLLNPNKDGPLDAAYMNFRMACVRGKQRSFPEFKTMLEAVGFDSVKSSMTEGHYSLVIARKP